MSDPSKKRDDEPLEQQISHPSRSSSDATVVQERAPQTEKDAAKSKRADGKIELTEEDAYEELGFGFSPRKKWTILTVIFLVQTSMNFNSSLYSNGLMGISERFQVSEQAARVGAAAFLATYAFGCELFAPWSEEIGRKPIMQLSLFFVNIWNLPVVLAPNFGSVVVGRALGGLSSAGGSVTLGMIADIYEADNQGFAIAFVVFSSVGGSVLGPIVGGFIEQYSTWKVCIWVQLGFGVVVQVLHLFFVPETRSTIMLDRIAKKRRKEGQVNIYGPNELHPLRERMSIKELVKIWVRPFQMFLQEPIVLTLSLLSGFSDALIFMLIQSLGIAYKRWGFSAHEIGLAFCAIGIGYCIAWAMFIPVIKKNDRMRAEKPDDEHAQYEQRLWFLLYTAPCLPIGLLIFAWTCTGPPIHWIGSMIALAIVGIANYAIYFATTSATGGNGFSRDFLASALTVPATPFFMNISSSKKYNLSWATMILFFISTLLILAVYVIYWKGPVLRKRSPFAQSLANGRDDKKKATHAKSEKRQEYNEKIDHRYANKPAPQSA